MFVRMYIDIEREGERDVHIHIDTDVFGSELTVHVFFSGFKGTHVRFSEDCLQLRKFDVCFWQKSSLSQTRPPTRIQSQRLSQAQGGCNLGAIPHKGRGSGF